MLQLRGCVGENFPLQSCRLPLHPEDCFSQRNSHSGRGRRGGTELRSGEGEGWSRGKRLRRLLPAPGAAAAAGGEAPGRMRRRFHVSACVSSQTQRCRRNGGAERNRAGGPERSRIGRFEGSQNGEPLRRRAGRPESLPFHPSRKRRPGRARRPRRWQSRRRRKRDCSGSATA